jgi:hypothetical protein
MTYQDYPDHPLHNVPQEILDAARLMMAGAVKCHDISVTDADPLADAVVTALLPWLTWTAGGDADAPERKWFTLRDGTQFFGTFAEVWRHEHPETDFGPEHIHQIVQGTSEGPRVTTIEHTARHDEPRGSFEWWPCSCGAVGWVLA